MFDRIFSAALAFCVLAGGTLAVGTAMLEQHQPEQRVVQLPRVEITGKRAQLAVEATLAQVESKDADRVQ
jgi:hypothetical protein